MPFLMPVEDVFTITGRGTVATGRVERGQLKLSDEVEIVGLTEEPRKTVVTGIEMFRKLLDYAEAGDNIGATSSWCSEKRNRKRSGSCKARHNYIRTQNSKVEVYVLTKEEGGRHTPFFNNYQSSVLFQNNGRYRRYQSSRRH